MISGAISADEFLAAQRLHLRHVVRRQLTILAIFVIVGLLIVWAGYFSPGIILFGVGAGGFIGQFILSKYSWPRRQLRIYNQQASLRSNFVYSWDTEHISVVADTGQAKRHWIDYVKSRENNQVFLLYHSDVMFEIIPKSWFHSSEQVETFRRLSLRAGA